MEFQPNRTTGEDWTLEALRLHFKQVIEDQDKRVSQLAAAQDKAVQAALIAQKEAVQAALAAADKAVTKAEAAAQDWRVSANEWRAAMNDRERTFVPRTEHEQAIRTIKESLAQQETWIHRAEGKGIGMNALWGYAVGGIMLGLYILEKVQAR